MASGDAGGAEEGLVADLGDVTFEDAAGKGIDGDVDGLVELDVDDVGLVDLDLGGDDGHVGEGHEGRAFAFWMPTTTVSPSRTGTLVTRPSKGARLMVLSRASKLERWVATAWFMWPAL